MASQRNPLAPDEKAIFDSVVKYTSAQKEAFRKQLTTTISKLNDNLENYIKRYHDLKSKALREGFILPDNKLIPRCENMCRRLEKYKEEPLKQFAILKAQVIEWGKDIELVNGIKDFSTDYASMIGFEKKLEEHYQAVHPTQSQEKNAGIDAPKPMLTSQINKMLAAKESELAPNVSLPQSQESVVAAASSAAVTPTPSAAPAAVQNAPGSDAPQDEWTNPDNADVSTTTSRQRIRSK